MLKDNMGFFSPVELKVLKIVTSKPKKVSELAEKFFNGDKPPLNPNAVVSSAIIRINKKCEYHKLTWFINGYGLGRACRTVFKDKLVHRHN